MIASILIDLAVIVVGNEDIAGGICRETRQDSERITAAGSPGKNCEHARYRIQFQDLVVRHNAKLTRSIEREVLSSGLRCQG